MSAHQVRRRTYPQFIGLLFFLLIAFAHPVSGKDVTVNAVLFYSPRCGSCIYVLTQVIPPLEEKYADNLHIIKIDVTQEAGRELYLSAINSFKVPNDRLGVPTLIIANEVLVGSQEIPDKFPALIEKGISEGGVGVPSIPGLTQYLAKTNQLPADRPAFVKKFLRDPAGNTLAIVVLIGLIVSLVWKSYDFIRVSVSVPRRTFPHFIPVLALIGLGVAIYLSFVETTSEQAFCGPIGDCNSVQQSPYARLFGLIPIGIIGALGYLAILLAWLFSRSANPSVHRISILAIWGMSWFGVLFSTYLTFLEPFVIGATCLWCITSAIVMILLLWVSTPMVKKVIEEQAPELDEEPEEASESFTG